MSWGGKREGAGRKPGYESEQRKTGYPTKVARIPEHWDVEDINGGLELLASLLDDASHEIKESAKQSKNGRCSNRLWKLEEYVKRLRRAFPKTW